MNQVETEVSLIVYSCVKFLPKSWQSPAISTQSMSSSEMLCAFSWSCAFKCRMNFPARWHVLHNMIEPDVKIANNWLQLKVVSQTQRQIYLQVSLLDWPNAMLESIVRRSRIDQVTCSELLHVSESLKLRSVDDFHECFIQFNSSVNWIVENLQKKCQLNKSMQTLHLFWCFTTMWAE